MKINSIGLNASILLLLAATIPGVAQGAVVISSAATRNMNCSDGVCAPTAKAAVLNVVDLENLLAAGDVEVTTTGSALQADTVEVNAPLSWGNGSVLDLNAYDSVRVNEPVEVFGDGGLTVVSSSGNFSFGPTGRVTFTGESNLLSINGMPYTLVATLPALVDAVVADPAGAYALASSYDARHDGPFRSSAITTTFDGMFNGLGNAISNLKIRGATQRTDYGLFSELAPSANVSSLHVVKMDLVAGPFSFAGGIAGNNFGLIFNSEVKGDMNVKHGEDGEYGGVVGSNSGTMDDTTSNVTINVGPGNSALMVTGDLVGGSNGTIENSFSLGPVVYAGASSEVFLGGLAGFNEGDVMNCYATGSVSIEGDSGDQSVGGLIGWNSLNVTSSYSTGAPSAGGTNNYIGGLIGLDESARYGGSMKNTYWDTTTSGISDPGRGAVNIENDPGITGEASEELQSKLPKGFKHSVWQQSQKLNGGLPYLVSNPPR